MTENLLEVDGVMFSYGLNRILASIYIRCEQGQVVGLLGRNGSGKSTLMKVMSSALDAEYSSVRINGTPQFRRFLFTPKIGYLPQDNLIPDYITLRQAFKLYGIAWTEVLNDFPEIEEVLDRKPRAVSGGQLRLAEVLLILYSKADFCLLDEPFSGLAPVMIERLGFFLSKIKVNKGVIITDHLYRHVASVSDMIYVLGNGQLKEISELSELVKYGYISGSAARVGEG